MTYVDFSNPLHRMDNLASGKFFRAYAALFVLIQDPEWSDMPVKDLRPTCAVLNEVLCEAFALELSTLVGRLVDVGSVRANDKDGQDQAATPTV